MDIPVYIPLSKLHYFEDHPYKILENEEMDALANSIAEYGVLSPLLVRPMEEAPDEYQIISGHRRFRAAQLAGLTTIPVFIKEISRDEAVILMVDSNLHRERLLPSEKAFAYKLKLDALKHQGRTCGQHVHKSRELVSLEESGRQIQRYIRLTYLIPELLQQVDSEAIAVTPAYELSFLKENQQHDLFLGMVYLDLSPSLSQAQQLRRLSEENLLTPEAIQSILSRPKANQKQRFYMSEEKLSAFFPSYFSPSQKEAHILKALTYYQNHLTRKRDLER